MNKLTLMFKSCNFINIRRYSSATFDIFKKLKDDKTLGSSSDSTDSRKPSDRVIKLVDEILNLTLIEAADLCDLCQEKLSGRSNNQGYIPGRSPFPHPHSLFSGMMYGGQPTPVGSVAPESSVPSQPSAAAPVEKVEEAEVEGRKTKTLKLVGFDSDKKISVIKIVRTICNLNLREAKELVESFPKTIKKDIPNEEAENLAKQLQEAGATVKIE